jgi:hypothetical protein
VPGADLLNQNGTCPYSFAGPSSVKSCRTEVIVTSDPIPRGWLSNQPVALENRKVVEEARALHEGCYLAKVAPEKQAAPETKR